MTATDATPTPLPEAWQDLLTALTLLAKGQNNDTSPLHCEHDTLTVCSDPAAFTAKELAELDRLGFFPDDEDGGAFTSFRFGSA